MNDLFSPKNLLRFALINVLVAFILSSFLCFSCLFTTSGLHTFFINYFLYSFMMSCLLSAGINRIIVFSDNHFPWLDNPMKRLLFDLIAVVIFTLIVSFILNFVFLTLVWQRMDAGEILVKWRAIASNAQLSIIISLGLTIFFTSRSFLLEWKAAAIETEKMKNEQLTGQYQSLKDQLNPHFLFNSLNVLSNLVYEDADKSNAFIEKLASIYRYVLDVQYKELVPLENELAFARSYLELQEVRFGSKFTYEIVANDVENFELPPLSLQLLLENALKHNRATRQEPLHISITQIDAKLCVRNNLQERVSESSHSGIGLTNIRERYRFVTDAIIEISDKKNGPSSEKSIFEVILPLINKVQKI